MPSKNNQVNLQCIINCWFDSLRIYFALITIYQMDVEPIAADVDND